MNDFAKSRRPKAAVDNPTALDLSLPEMAWEIDAAASAAHDHAKHAVEQALRAGGLLIRAKARVPHGEWLLWLEANLKFVSKRMAQGYMQLAQQVLERPEMLSAITELPLRNALALVRSVLETSEKEEDSSADESDVPGAEAPPSSHRLRVETRTVPPSSYRLRVETRTETIPITTYYRVGSQPTAEACSSAEDSGPPPISLIDEDLVRMADAMTAALQSALDMTARIRMDGVSQHCVGEFHRHTSEADAALDNYVQHCLRRGSDGLVN